MLRARYLLDQPLPVQYLHWLAGIPRGDIGWSTSNQRPVAAVLWSVLPNTLLLMGLAFTSSVAFGVLLGAWQGAHAESRSDRALSLATLTAISVPEFCLGLLLLLLLPTTFAVTGATSDYYDLETTSQQLYDRLVHFVRPWLTLTIVGVAVFARFQRAAMRDSMREPFTRTARAKGLRESAVRRHALRASLLPVITLAGLAFPMLLGGAVVAEKVFSWPGMGLTMFTAIGERDYALVSGGMIVGSLMTVLGNLLADVARALVDPRVPVE
jgi:peptide/nickel transport system permease protein